MSWKPDWEAMNARIAALIDAGDFYLRGQSSKTGDPYGVATKRLMPASERLFHDVKRFSHRFDPSLPGTARTVLSAFLGENEGLFTDRSIPAFPGVRARLTVLAALRSELSYHLHDAEAIALSLTERAFVHLQRSITADPTIRERWVAAFAAGERACESLGANHLLLHGIWAFKVSEAGEQTDLVLDEPITDVGAIERTSLGLVLTEWKLVRAVDKASGRAEAAVRQAERYSVGVLASVELSNHRYIVLVSEKHLPARPSIEVHDGISYHFVNVVVDPGTPSRA